MREAAAGGGGAAAVESAAHAGVGRALTADREAARRAAAEVAGRTVLTLSRSGTGRSSPRTTVPLRPPSAAVTPRSRSSRRSSRSSRPG